MFPPKDLKNAFGLPDPRIVCPMQCTRICLLGGLTGKQQPERERDDDERFALELCDFNDNRA
jgi:hypothetical protein